MKSVELSDESYERLQQLAADQQQTPAEAIAALLAAQSPVKTVLSPLEPTNALFAAIADPADRYLALLAWVAQNHAADFADFVAHQDSGRRYLQLDRTELNALRQQHHTRQIDGTPYWAIMNISDADKSRFVRRLLEYIGCHDRTIAEILRGLAFATVESDHEQRRLSVV